MVVETTGLADPAPVLSTLLGEPVIRHQYALEAVVATVDALNGAATLDHHRDRSSRRRWPTCSSYKADAAPAREVEALEARLRDLNQWLRCGACPTGRWRRTSCCPPGRATRPLDRPGVPPAAAHAHDLRTFTLVLHEPLDWDAFAVWLTMLLHARGLDVLRVKGLLDVGGAGPVLLDGVQHVVHPPRHLDAWPDDDRRSRIVFITRGIEREPVEASLRAFTGLERAGRAGVVP